MVWFSLKTNVKKGRKGEVPTPYGRFPWLGFLKPSLTWLSGLPSSQVWYHGIFKLNFNFKSFGDKSFSQPRDNELSSCCELLQFNFPSFVVTAFWPKLCNILSESTLTDYKNSSIGQGHRMLLPPESNLGRSKYLPSSADTPRPPNLWQIDLHQLHCWV